MTRSPIIPENTSKRKFVIWQQLNLTIVDLAVWAFFIGIGAVTGFFLWKMGNIFKIIGILSGSLFIIAGFLLNTKSSFHNKKYYAVGFDWFIFLFTNKKYKLNSKYDSLNLVPYQKIDGEHIKLKNNLYMSMIKVQGNSFFDYELLKQETILERIWDIYHSLNLGGTLIKLDELKSRNQTLFFLEEKRHEWEVKRKTGEINDKQYFSRIRLIEMEIEKYSTFEANNIFEWIEKSIYVAFYANSIEDIKQIENRIVAEYRRANLIAYKIDVIKKINVLNKIVDTDLLDDNENNIFKFKNNLDHYFAYNVVENKPSYLKIDKNLKLTINSVEGYAQNPECGWIGQIFNIDSPVVVNFNKVSDKVFQETLSKARRTAIATANATSKKEILTQRKRQQEVEKLEEFADIIGYGTDELYKFNIYVVNKGTTTKELNKSIKDTKKSLKQLKLLMFANPYRQIEAFSGMLPKPYDPLMEVNGREIPLYSLVWGMPYVNNSLNDIEGWFIGNSIMGDELFFNSHIRNEEKRNANMFFVATTGAGKTTTMQRLLKNEILNGNKVFIVDPENEYSKFADYFGEDKIFLGDGIYKINPLQIMPSLADIQNEEEHERIEYNKGFWNINKDTLVNKEFSLNETLILNHQSIIEILFKTFFKDLSEEDIRYLKNKFWFFYTYWLNKTKNKNILEWENNDFPIMQDFYDWLKLNNENNSLYKKLTELLEDGFVVSNNGLKKGTYAMFYNGYTSIDISKKYLTIFDMSSLKDGSDRRLLSMQMFLVIKLLERQVKVNNGLQPNTAQRIIIDEAHLLIDKDFPIALDFIFRMSKMIRKRNGGITAITQNPEDFLSTSEIEKKTKAIINNSQYAFVMKSNSKNIELIESLYSDNDGFTNQEKAYLLDATGGEGLLITSRTRRYLLKMDVQADDFKIIKGDETDLITWTLNYLTTRLFNMINGLKYIDINEEECVYIDKKDESKKLYIKLKNNHNLRSELLNKNIEVKQCEIKNNLLTINFKELHKEIGVKFLDKVRRKIEFVKGVEVSEEDS